MEKTAKFVRKYAQIITAAYLILMMAVFPFYAPQGYVEIGTHKFFFFKIVSIVCFGLLCPAALYLFAYALKKKKIRISSTDICVLLYGAAVLVSFVCSEWKEEALWGADGWFMGMVPQLFFVAGYFAVSRFTKDVKLWYVLGIGVSAIVFLLGVLNRFSVYPVQMEGANPGFISTLGNINWFCSYWMVLFPIGLVAYRSGFGDTWLKKAGLVCYILLGFITGISQGSSSGFLALGAVGFVLFFLSFPYSNKLLRWLELVMMFAVSALILGILKEWFPQNYNYQDTIGEFLTRYTTGILLLGLSAVCYAGLYFLIRKQKVKNNILFMVRNVITVIMVITVAGILGLTLFYSANPDRAASVSVAERFIIDSDWGNGRGTTWYAGEEGFASLSFVRKFIGIGPDCFYLFVYENPEISAKLYEVFGGARLTNAHNEWLTILVNTGLFGLLTYAAAFISSAVRQLKAGKTKEFLVIGAVCLISYTVHNMVSFQQVICTPLIFLIMGLGEKTLRSEN